MLKINKKIEYAMMSLKFMAERDSTELTSAREICDKFNIPFDTTAKVLQVMNNHGVLESVKGIKGGYLLNKSLEQYSFMDLYNMIEGTTSENHCIGNKGLCELFDNCNIVAPMDGLFRKVKGYLENLSLQELLINEKSNSPQILEMMGNK